MQVGDRLHYMSFVYSCVCVHNKENVCGKDSPGQKTIGDVVLLVILVSSFPGPDSRLMIVF